MLINIQTKYNIDDEIYVITEIPKHNDWYCTEIIWTVETNDFDRRKFNSFKIETIFVKQHKDYIEILYKVNGCLYSEDKLFINLEDAKLECKNRNKE